MSLSVPVLLPVELGASPTRGVETCLDISLLPA
jgi:hypothetical protein